MIKLYDFPLSGHAHRVRLMLSLLGLSYETITVDLAGGEHKQPAFLALNRFARVPVLVDNDLVIRDSVAILVYLARQYGPQWYPQEPATAARIQEWLALATRELSTGPGAARLVAVFNAPLDHQALIEDSHALFADINEHLEGRQWLALDTASIADVAAYSYIAVAPEGGVNVEPYPAIRQWLERVEGLPGFVAMPAAPKEAVD